MPRQARYIPSGYPHEICIRVKQGLPFPCWLLIRLLLASAMARAARDQRVIICDFVWMNNHLHLLVIVADPNQCKLFYTELQKRLTDYIKRLLGVKQLHMWEGRPLVATILDPAKVVERKAYFYLNPSRANLVESINDYPGFTSWRAFNLSDDSTSKVVEKVPFIRCPSLKPLRTESISAALDQCITEELSREAKEFEELSIEPNAWAACFGLTEYELKEHNKDLRNIIESTEATLAQSRKKEGRKPVGASRLRSQPLFKSHTPLKKERKVYVLSSIKELRVEFILMVKRLTATCRDLYSKNLFHLWPPGMFRPPAPPLASALGWK